MRLSTKGRYGLRAMVDLAFNSKGDHVSLNSIAERQDISKIYLEQVFAALRKSGLVKSVKGAQGGYVLTGKPSEITVGAVLRALEGSLSVVDSNSAVNGAKESILDQCVRTKVWDRINESISELVDSITLEDLLDEYRMMNASQALMYYI